MKKFHQIFKRWSKSFSFLWKKFVLLIVQNICENKFAEKKSFVKKIIFLKNGNVSGNECWQNEYLMIWKIWELWIWLYERLDEVTSGMKGKEMSSDSWDKTSMIGRLLFNNELDNLDKQLWLPRFSSSVEIINAFMHCLRRSVVVSVNYGHSYP